MKTVRSIRKPAALLFDFGDTVLEMVKFDPLKGNARLLHLAKNPRNVTAAEVANAARKLSDTLRPLTESLMLELQAECFHKLLYEGLGLSFRQSALQLQREFWKHSSAYRPEPGICSLLQFLRKQNVRMGIVSNTMFPAAFLKDELRRCRLLQYFEFVVASADYGIRKPHPLIFSAALARLDLPAKLVWFAGDKLEYDIKGANDAGLFSVWYNRKNGKRTKERPALEISCWDQLTGILDQASRLSSRC